MKHIKKYTDFINLKESYNTNSSLKISVPFILGDKVTPKDKNKASYIINISGVVDADLNAIELIYDTTEATRYRPKDFEYDGISNKTIVLTPKYTLGGDIFFLDTRRMKLKSEPIIKIQFDISKGQSEIYWYRTKSNIFNKEEAYTDINDFVIRTKPSKPLTDGQKYIFTNYLHEQNKLEPVTLEKVSDTEYKVYGEIYKDYEIYDSHDSFINYITR